MDKVILAQNRGLLAYVEAGRCDADGWYWRVSIDGGTHSDGTESTEQEAINKCRLALAETKDAAI